MNADYMISMLSPQQDKLLKGTAKQLKEIKCFEYEGTIFKGDAWLAALNFAYNNPTGGDLYVWLQDNYKILEK